MYKNNQKIKPSSAIKSSFIIIGIIVFLLFFLEIFARKKFNSFSTGNCPHVKMSNDLNFYTPSKNCIYSQKNWEHSRKIIYQTDSLSNRKSTLPISSNGNMIKFAFFGDSFTWGAMNSSNENYTHHAIADLVNKKNIIAGYDNYGVQAYNLLEVIERMNQTELKNYDFIIYGLTPNDLFSPQILSLKKENIEKVSFLDLVMKKIKTHNLRSVKVVTKLIFDFFPKVYINLYTLRDSNLSGYLSPSSSIYWDERYSELSTQLKKLDVNIRNKLIIQIIAQRVQVQLYKAGDISNAMAFDNQIKKLCNELSIRCNGSQLHELSLLENSHYTIDGHFNSEANSIVGKELAEFIYNK